MRKKITALLLISLLLVLNTNAQTVSIVENRYKLTRLYFAILV